MSWPLTGKSNVRLGCDLRTGQASQCGLTFWWFASCETQLQSRCLGGQSHFGISWLSHPAYALWQGEWSPGFPVEPARFRPDILSFQPFFSSFRPQFAPFLGKNGGNEPKTGTNGWP